MEVEIKRSARRSKSVSARQIGDRIVVTAPQEMSEADLTPIVDKLRGRLERRRRQQEAARGLNDADLETRAAILNRTYFDGALVWQSVVWTTVQNARWGSCTPDRGTIRLSHRLATVPVWVRDYVLVHELAHLREANHGPRFWALVNRYLLSERARGYLIALSGESGDDDM